MYEVFLATLSPMLVIFLCLFIGFVLRKGKILPSDTDKSLSKLETYLLCPALSLSVFSKYCTVENLKNNYQLVLYASLVLAVAIAIAILLSRVFQPSDLYKRNIYKYALAFANWGFMGNAIVPMILGGTEHLFYYQLFTLPISFATYLWGVNILTPKEYRKGSAARNLFNAPMLGVLLGMLLGLTGLGNQMPAFFTTTVDSLSACMGPLAMVLTGFVIGGYAFKDLLLDKKVYAATALRLIVLPSVFIALLLLLGASSYVLVLALFAYGTPLGMNTVVFPAAYGGETKTGASMAMISHTLSIVTIPLLYSLLTLIV
jgi:predicted permease